MSMLLRMNEWSDPHKRRKCISAYTAAKNDPFNQRRRWPMNSGIVSGASVSPTADLTNFKTQFAFGFALGVSILTSWS